MHGNTGKIRSNETRQKLRDKHLGTKLSKETREKISISLLGNTRRRGKEFKQNRVHIDPTTGCHNWMLGCDKEGYPIVKKFGHQWRGHRFYWASVNGPIPLGFDLHHTCLNRKCVNPAHSTLITKVNHGRLHSNGIPAETIEAIKQLAKQGYSSTKIKDYLKLDYSARAIRNYMK